MDIQAIVDQVLAAVKDAPEKLGDLASDPRAAIEGIIGEGKLGDTDPAEILARIKDRVADADLSGIDLSGLAANLPDQLKGMAEGVDVSGVADQLGGFLSGFFNKK